MLKSPRRIVEENASPRSGSGKSGATSPWNFYVRSKSRMSRSKHATAPTSPRTTSPSMSYTSPKTGTFVLPFIPSYDNGPSSSSSDSEDSEIPVLILPSSKKKVSTDDDISES
jgi:hypothetical protein